MTRGVSPAVQKYRSPRARQGVWAAGSALLDRAQVASPALLHCPGTLLPVLDGAHVGPPAQVEAAIFALSSSSVAFHLGDALIPLVVG